MRILFCNITWMEKYNGVVDRNKLKNGGSWVNENNDAMEKNNFTERNGYYRGYVSTGSNRDKINQIRIERLEGVSKNDDKAEDVLVVWVAKNPKGSGSRVVGWYKNATVLRHRDEEDKTSIIAKKGNCFLLPEEERLGDKWMVPRANTDGYGMGQSNIWYGKKDNEKSNNFINEMYERINSYHDKISKVNKSCNI